MNLMASNTAFGPSHYTHMHKMHKKLLVGPLILSAKGKIVQQPAVLKSA